MAAMKPTEQVNIAFVLTAEEAQALAQMCKRFCWEDAERFGSRFDKGKERDHILDAVAILRRALGEKGFAPR